MDTEAFGGGDSQHPRGVVSIRIHTEEQLENTTQNHSSFRITGS